MSIVKFPSPPVGRVEKLRAALRDVDTSTMTTAEVADLCEEVLPDCTVEEIVSALRDVGLEHYREADQLLAFDKRRASAPQPTKPDTFLDDFLP